MSFDDLVYLQKRAQEAREQARASADPRAQAIHLKFAAQYERRRTSFRARTRFGLRATQCRSLDLLASTSRRIINA